MTQEALVEPGEGERLYAERRKRFWKLIGALLLVGLAGGLAAGFISGFADSRGLIVEPLYNQVAAAGVVLLAILAAYFSWRFFVSVDELEVADNLWGSLIGFYAYAIALPSWSALHKLGKAPEPDHWLIYIFAMLVALAAYAVRKWQAR